MLLLTSILLLCAMGGHCQSDGSWLILRHVRVLDPETMADLSHQRITICGGKIISIDDDDDDDGLDLDVEEAVDVVVRDCSGLVAAPGFIDLHAHGQDGESRRFQVQDGVTTALELEVGVHPVAEWYSAQEREGSVNNYGATVGHIPVRMLVMDGREVDHVFHPRHHDGNVMRDGAWSTSMADEEQEAEIMRLLERGLNEGGLGIGFGIAYTMGATSEEIESAFRVAAAADSPVFTHVRVAGKWESFDEVLDAAERTAASLHVVHIGSSGLHLAPAVVARIEEDRRRGLDFSCEIYPYAAGCTRLESRLFEDGFQERENITWGDLQWVETGERLTEATFTEFRSRGGLVVIHSQDEAVVDAIVQHPEVIIASDGIPVIDGQTHPRSSGTFSRVLGRYVESSREGGDDGHRPADRLTLMQALRKMTLLPAKRLEGRCPQMKKKGRLQEGMDADVTVFDPLAIEDRSTYLRGAVSSAGIRFVAVGGELVVDKGALLEGVFPGRGIRATTALVGQEGGVWDRKEGFEKEL